MAATGMQELVEVDSLSMTLLFGERRVGEETGVPTPLLPTIAPVRRGAHEEKLLRRKEALLQ